MPRRKPEPRRPGPDLDDETDLAEAAAIFGDEAALIRKGREAHAAGGPATLEAIQREITAADPRRAKTRAVILAAAWSGIMERG